MKEKSTLELMRPEDSYGEILSLREKEGIDFYHRYHVRFQETLCPACGHSGEYVFSKFGFHHQRCSHCRTVFCSPRPDETLLSLYYNEFEAPKRWTELLLKTDVNRKALQYQPRVEQIVEFLKKMGYPTMRTALDIGCGSGAFMISLHSTPYFEEVLGLDLSQKCVKVCKERKLNVQQGTLSVLSENSVDIIFINDLIEHLYDPGKFLKDCSRVLRKNGFIAIACPNGEGFDFLVMKEKTLNITPPEHLNYFNPDSLSLLLRNHGFDPKLVETPGKLDMEIILKEREKGLDLKNHNEFLDFIYAKNNPALLAQFQKFLVESKLSSHMLVLAQLNS